jgi:ComF family protein
LKIDVKPYLKSLLGIVYPATCAACGNALYINEDVLCLKCYIDLPKTGYHNDSDNDVARLLWGRIPFKNATSYFFFNKESKYRHILHELKYQGQKQTGLVMGRLFGLDLLGTPFAETDLIIPVPLHASKYRMRGYNQSELIALGISEILKIPVKSDLITRTANTTSQTRKSRFDRWLNVVSTFRINNHEALFNKHILLVDDVITTGATIEACANALYEITGITLSIATLAYTKI